MKHLKYFKTEANYTAYKDGEDFILPNVSYAVDTDSVFYHVVKTEIGDYKILLLDKKNMSGLTYNMVDLGLPSGRLWADRNVGASSPEDYGAYFAWGETSGYNESTGYCTAAELCTYLQPLLGDAMELTPDNIDEILSMLGIEGKDMTVIGFLFGKDKCFNSDWSDYFDTTDGGSTFNKYAIDKLTILQPEDDAATVNMGSEYRMPTEADFNELINNCTVTFIDLQDNEVSSPNQSELKGIKFTGSNGNSIFIPASGYYRDTMLLNDCCNGILWSSSLNSGKSMDIYCFTFDYNGNFSIINNNRYLGQAVRGVK